jgi:predicted nucleic acid-binding protein
VDAVLDTSVLIAETEQGLHLPGIYGVSVMSIAELHRGAVTAGSAAIRSRRVARLALVEELYETLPIDRRIAVKYGEIAATTQRLASRPHVIDGLIAATAIVIGIPVLTRDHDFDLIPGLDVVIV